MGILKYLKRIKYSPKKSIRSTKKRRGIAIVNIVLDHISNILGANKKSTFRKKVKYIGLYAYILLFVLLLLVRVILACSIEGHTLGTQNGIIRLSVFGTSIIYLLLLMLFLFLLKSSQFALFLCNLGILLVIGFDHFYLNFQNGIMGSIVILCIVCVIFNNVLANPFNENFSFYAIVALLMSSCIKDVIFCELNDKFGVSILYGSVLILFTSLVAFLSHYRRREERNREILQILGNKDLMNHGKSYFTVLLKRLNIDPTYGSEFELFLTRIIENFRYYRKFLPDSIKVRPHLFTKKSFDVSEKPEIRKIKRSVNSSTYSSTIHRELDTRTGSYSSIRSIDSTKNSNISSLSSLHSIDSEDDMSPIHDKFANRELTLKEITFLLIEISNPMLSLDDSNCLSLEAKVKQTVTEYLDVVFGEVHSRKGMIYSINGSNVLVVYNSIIPSPMHNLNAINSAYSIFNILRRDLPQLNVSMSIIEDKVHCGDITSEFHSQYIIFGKYEKILKKVSNLNKNMVNGIVFTREVNNSVKFHFETRQIDIIDEIPIFILIKKRIRQENQEWLYAISDQLQQKKQKKPISNNDNDSSSKSIDKNLIFEEEEEIWKLISQKKFIEANERFVFISKKLDNFDCIHKNLMRIINIGLNSL